MKRQMLFCLAPVFLAACATPQPGIEIRTVEVPVPQPCLSKEQLAEPRFAEPPLVGDRLGRVPETAAQDRDILGASALMLRAWGKELFAAHKACAE